MGGYFHLLLFILGVASGLNYIPHQKDILVSDLLLQDMMEKLSKDLSVAADGYLDLPETSRLQANNILVNRVIKDLDNEEITDPIDFERLPNNPSPSIRDQEYLQHSSLWGHQKVAGGAGEGKQRLKPDGSVKNKQQVKSDSTLPAYCNPPNPCPLGFKGDEGCIEKFENSAAFSRDYQRSQDCMCDSEHMFECSEKDYRSRGIIQNTIDRIVEQLSGENNHKNLVAKKYHFKKNVNPFLEGEKLPVAAKKGIHLLAGK